MKQYAKRMTLDDRRIIERMYKDGASVKEISIELGRNESGVYRELNIGCTGKLDKNGKPGYSAKLGDDRAAANRANKGRPRSILNQIHTDQSATAETGGA